MLTSRRQRKLPSDVSTVHCLLHKKINDTSSEGGRERRVEDPQYGLGTPFRLPFYSDSNSYDITVFLTNKNSQNLAVSRTILTSLTDSDTQASWTTVLSASKCTNKNSRSNTSYRPTTSRCDNQRLTVNVRHPGTPASMRQPVAGLVETSRCTQLVTTHISIITAVFSRPAHCRQVQVLWLLRFYPAVATIRTTQFTYSFCRPTRSETMELFCLDC